MVRTVEIGRGTTIVTAVRCWQCCVISRAIFLTSSFVPKENPGSIRTGKNQMLTSEIAELLGVKESRARLLMGRLALEGDVETIGKNRNRKYRKECR